MTGHARGIVVYRPEPVTAVTPRIIGHPFLGKEHLTKSLFVELRRRLAAAPGGAAIGGISVCPGDFLPVALAFLPGSAR